MYTYILRRVLLLIPTMLIVSVIVFLSVRLIPGDVIDVMFAQMSVSSRSNLPSREALEAALGLDRPLHVQYLQLARRHRAARRFRGSADGDRTGRRC